MSTVTFSNVTKKYNDSIVLNHLNFKIQDNEFVSFLGPSGCGKTTCLRMIAGLEKNTEGSIYIDDALVSSPKENIFLTPEKRKLGMVFQSYAIWPHMNVFNNVAFPLKMSNVTTDEINKSVMDILRLVELDHLVERMPQTLSGGQQQRVALARGLVSKPKVLLLDEPLSNLDAKLREKMRRDIRELQQHFKLTCIYVTHDQVEAFSMSDRIMILNKGEILQFDTPSNIRNNPSNSFVKDFIS